MALVSLALLTKKVRPPGVIAHRTISDAYVFFIVGYAPLSSKNEFFYFMKTNKNI